MKLPLIIKPSDYIHWKRRLYTFLRKDDHELTGLSAEPEGVTKSVIRTWKRLSTEAKSHLVLSLGPDAISQTRRIIDDDEKSAKDLWDELNRIYTTTSGQAVQNLRQKLDSLVYDENKSWNDHVSSFLRICEELATYDEEITEDEWRQRLDRMRADYERRAVALGDRESAVAAAEARVESRARELGTERDRLKTGAMALSAEADGLRWVCTIRSVPLLAARSHSGAMLWACRILPSRRDSSFRPFCRFRRFGWFRSFSFFPPFSSLC